MQNFGRERIAPFSFATDTDKKTSGHGFTRINADFIRHDFACAFFFIPNRDGSRNKLLALSHSPGKVSLKLSRRRMGGCGGCCEWVLAAACEAVEWPSQPLGFESLALRSVTRYYRRVLTRSSVRLELKMQAAVSAHFKPRVTLGALAFLTPFLAPVIPKRLSSPESHGPCTRESPLAQTARVHGGSGTNLAHVGTAAFGRPVFNTAPQNCTEIKGHGFWAVPSC